MSGAHPRPSDAEAAVADLLRATASAHHRLHRREAPDASCPEWYARYLRARGLPELDDGDRGAAERSS